jgi:1-deoxy-D-xylulose-5-phosphate reductoisomerase
MSQQMITILGSTGSIGTQTIEVVRAHHPTISFGFLTTNKRVALLAEQVRLTNPFGVVIRDKSLVDEFIQLSDFKGVILTGEEGLCQAAEWERNTIVMSSLIGFSGVLPTLHAIKAGKTIALANKETLVSAGSFIVESAKKHNVQIIAVDSEHSAILQCLLNENTQSIEKLILTASGGPFRNYSNEQLRTVTASQALKHPNWEMGAKITIDSATLMNKGFEMIEAMWLFDVKPSNIEVVVHPQSIIHSMVQFVDGSIKAQLGLPDMKLPIHYALTFPERRYSNFERMDWKKISTLTFEQPDTQRFPCLQLAYSAMERGGTSTAILNAANEIAVAEFLAGRIGFCDIPRIIEETMGKISTVDSPTLDDIISADQTARSQAMTLAQAITNSMTIL